MPKKAWAPVISRSPPRGTPSSAQGSPPATSISSCSPRSLPTWRSPARVCSSSRSSAWQRPPRCQVHRRARRAGKQTLGLPLRTPRRHRPGEVQQRTPRARRGSGDAHSAAIDISTQGRTVQLALRRRRRGCRRQRHRRGPRHSRHLAGHRRSLRRDALPEGVGHPEARLHPGRRERRRPGRREPHVRSDGQPDGVQARRRENVHGAHAGLLGDEHGPEKVDLFFCSPGETCASTSTWPSSSRSRTRRSFYNIQRYGNTTAATIPILLAPRAERESTA